MSNNVIPLRKFQPLSKDAVQALQAVRAIKPEPGMLQAVAYLYNRAEDGIDIPPPPKPRIVRLSAHRRVRFWKVNAIGFACMTAVLAYARWGI